MLKVRLSKLLHQLWIAHLHTLGCHIFPPKWLKSCYPVTIFTCWWPKVIVWRLHIPSFEIWLVLIIIKKYNKTSLPNALLCWKICRKLHPFPIFLKLHKPTRDGFVFEEYTFPHPDYSFLLHFFLPLENSQSIGVIVVYFRTSGDPCVYRSGIKEAKPGR